MRSTNSLLIFAAATVASAGGLTVSPYLHDGLYAFDMASGNITRFQPFSGAAAPANAMRKVKRADFPGSRSVACGDHRVLQNSDENAAWQKLTWFCQAGSKIWKDSGHFAKGVVWYVCNYAWRDDQWCNYGEMDQAGGILNGECHDMAGWIHIGDRAKRYGRDVPDVKICDSKGVSDQ